MGGMSTTRTLALNTGVQIAGKIVSTAIGVVVIGLMTRYLGLDGFGMYSSANAYFQIFAIILDLGLNVMLVQMLGERAGDTAYENRAVSATFTLRLVMAGVFLTFAAFLGLLMPYPFELKIAIFALWGSFFFSALNQIVIGVHQRHMKMHVVALAEILGRVVLLGGILLARAEGWGLLAIVTIVSLGGFANFLLNALVARRFASVSWNWDPEFWITILKRAWPIGVSILFNLIYFKADTLILSYVRPFAEVGIYSAAYRVLEILITVPFMYTGVMLPILAKAWITKNHEHFQKLYRNSLVAMLLISAPMIGGIGILGTRVMTLVAGKDFAASGDILRVLVIAVVLIFVGTVSSHAIVALDAQRNMLPIYIIVALLTLLGYVTLIPPFGMWAAAWLTVASEGAVALASTLISLRKSQTSVEVMPYLKILIATVVMALCILPLQNLPLVIPILAGGVVYVGLVLLLGVVSTETLKEVLSFRRDATQAEIEL